MDIKTAEESVELNFLIYSSKGDWPILDMASVFILMSDQRWR